jgi:hypothetical protein
VIPASGKPASRDDEQQRTHRIVVAAQSLIAFPWTDRNSYSKVASYARVSFPCARVLCALVSMLLFRGRPVVTGAVTS